MQDTAFLVVVLLAMMALTAFLVQLSANQKLRAIIRTGLRKAESDHSEMVRIPYNQLAEAIGWDSELYPMRDDKEFKQCDIGHPATLSPARRRKLQ